MRSKQLMFTYNGDWGLLVLSESPSPLGDVVGLVAHLKKMPAVERMWSQVQEEASRWNIHLASDDYIVCLELCTTTWREKGEI